jgi:rare lipoprotein A
MMSWKIIWNSCATALALTAPTAAARADTIGTASYYGKGFHGRVAANGERFNMHALTAAHRSLPFGTRLQITNMANGRSVVVRIQDRGPYIRGRVLDLSYGAACELDMVDSGLAQVRIAALDSEPATGITRR